MLSEIWTYSKFRQHSSCSEFCYLRGFNLLDATDLPIMTNLYFKAAI